MRGVALGLAIGVVLVMLLVFLSGVPHGVPIGFAEYEGTKDGVEYRIWGATRSENDLLVFKARFRNRNDHAVDVYVLGLRCPQGRAEAWPRNLGSMERDTPVRVGPGASKVASYAVSVPGIDSLVMDRWLVTQAGAYTNPAIAKHYYDELYPDSLPMLGN